MADWMPDWLSGIIGGGGFRNSPGQMSFFAPNGVSAEGAGAMGPFNAPGAGGSSGTNTGFGTNMGSAQLGLGLLGGAANAFSAFQANTLANKQFGLARDLATTNLTNSIKSYNTRLEDTARSRASAEGTAFNAGEYVDRNRLTR